jgi:hypothetical protein
VQIYVLRIYRQNARRLGGVLEDAQTGRSVSFRTLRELAVLLRTTSVQAARRKRQPVQAARAASQQAQQGE